MKITTIDTFIEEFRNGINIWSKASIELVVREISRSRKRIEELEAEQQKRDELLKYVLRGAAQFSCLYKENDEINDPTFHCCDWNTVVEDIHKLFGWEKPKELVEWEDVELDE